MAACFPLALWPYSFFDPKSRTERQQRQAPAVEDAAGRASRLYCARCRHAITRTDERISVNGQHDHSFVNPYGLQFHIGCFRRAPGCAAVGGATAEHTWFPGYAWRVAVCGRCDGHLGWMYTAAGDGFYGLIIGRLTAGSDG